MITEANRENFRELVAEGVTLVDVWGPSCQPCLALRPHVEAMAEARAGTMDIIALEAPNARRLCMELKVMGLPAFLLFKDGEEVDRLSGGDITSERLDEWVDGQLTSLSDGAGRG